MEGALAADSLIAAPTRTSATVAALMLSLALVIGLAGIARGSYARISDWMNTALNPDLFVTSSPSLTERTYKFPDAMTAELEAIPGIAEVQRQRTARIQMGGSRVLIIAAELGKIATAIAAAGRRRAISTRCSGSPRPGAASIASENFATLRHARLGDIIDIPSPSGVLRLPLVGVIREYSDQQGALFIDRTLFTERWRDDTVDFFRVYLEPGASARAGEGSDPGEVRGQPAHLRAVERRGAALRHGADRPVVHDDLGADRRLRSSWPCSASSTRSRCR